MDKDINEKIEAAIGEIRPRLQDDGGDIEFVGVTDDNVVQVRLRGACAGCPGAVMTLKMGVERIIKERVPSIKSVENVGSLG
ncbi:MAG: NifU family protein [Chitinispirillales bacterium]|jgi:Fe-S cluster biogenesis protein NfuA|nr:NifU family protein [Chitinispirillales bacterium]